MSRERRALTIFWLTVLLFTLGAFAADALLRQRVCAASSMVEVGQPPIIFPVECS